MDTRLTVLGLPPEILTSILSYLPIIDLLRASKTCRGFHSAADVAYKRNRLSQIEKCDSHSHAVQDSGILAYDEVYRKLMAEYQYILGTWKIVSTCYGGLLHVRFDGFKLLGQRYNMPPNPHTDWPLKANKMFVVQIDLSGNTQCICYQGYGKPHVMKIEPFETHGFNGFRLSCLTPEVHAHKEGNKAEYNIWLCNELGLQKISSELPLSSQSLHEYKFNTLSKETSVDCLPLELPASKDNVPIQPGLFKGTYGDHGIELVMLTYDDDKDQAIITKITGDPNIPANKVSVIVDLEHRIYLSEDQQKRLNEFSSAKRIQLQRPAAVAEALERFLLPSDYTQRSDHVPELCCARYESQGQIAGHGYIYPTFVDSNWVVFDENTFGIVWIALSSFSIFTRVTQTIT